MENDPFLEHFEMSTTQILPVSPQPSKTPIEKSKVESELAQIWGEILSIEPPGLDEDYFSLGGDSRLANKIFSEIERRFGVKLARVFVLEYNTVRKLSTLITSDPASLREFLVAIQPLGNRKPIFLIPGAYGDIFYLRNLINYIEADRPLYGLQAPPPRPDRTYGEKVEDIASSYLAEILQFQPEGPYYLAGHSFGGYVALEIAHQLKKQGREVAFLGVWDTYPPGPRRKANLIDRFMIHLKNLRGLNSRQVLDYFRDRWVSLLLRVSHLAPVRSYLKWVKYSPRKKSMLGSTISRYSYNPEPYRGNLFLFTARHRPWYMRWDPMENWRKYVQGELHILEVDREHDDLVFEPQVQELARHFNACLQLVDSKK